MAERAAGFYDELAEHYHLIFDDWGAAIARQAGILGPLIDREIGRSQDAEPLRLLDCACGIGTQALGFARMGHNVTGSDLSAAAIARAQLEAEVRGLGIDFVVADMRDLKELPDHQFDLVAAFDNALPHLTLAELKHAAAAVALKLEPGGLLMASIRDYDALIVSKPVTQMPAFFGDDSEGGSRRIVHQVWDWVSDREYVVHLYITVQTGSGWETKHFTSTYHCLLRKEITAVLEQAGFVEVAWRMPGESGYYQPVVAARLGNVMVEGAG